jgi:hypothetical protein
MLMYVRWNATGCSNYNNISKFDETDWGKPRRPSISVADATTDGYCRWTNVAGTLPFGSKVSTIESNRPKPSKCDTYSEINRRDLRLGLRQYYFWGGYSPAPRRGGPGSSTGHVVWDSWWTVLLCGRFSQSTSVSPAKSHFHQFLQIHHHPSTGAGAIGQWLTY